MSRLRAIAAASALAASLTLGGCGLGHADMAAKVDGRVITEDAARTAAEQINTAFTPDQPLSTANAVEWLVSAGSIIKVAESKGHIVTPDTARSAMASKVSDPTPETLDIVRANFAWNWLQQNDPTAPQALAEDLKKTPITVNPRYGVFDKQSTGLAPVTENWIADNT